MIWREVVGVRWEFLEGIEETEQIISAEFFLWMFIHFDWIIMRLFIEDLGFQSEVHGEFSQSERGGSLLPFEGSPGSGNDEELAVSWSDLRVEVFHLNIYFFSN